MDPLSIALICAAAFGVIVTLIAFITMLFLSRDKKINDEAQRTALAQESAELEKMRKQLQSNSRFESHYSVLGSNKDAIMYIDAKIEEILTKKTELIERYAKLSSKESGAMIEGASASPRKAMCDRLKVEIDEEIAFYATELERLQKRRHSLWDAGDDMQHYLLEQERLRNENLDYIYKEHSGFLEKIYLRNLEMNAESTKQTIEAGTSAIKNAVKGPIDFLSQYFTPSSGISLKQSKKEGKKRKEVQDLEQDINDGDEALEDLDKKNDSSLLIA